MNKSDPSPAIDYLKKETPSDLVWLASGFEEMETIAPIDLLRRAGAIVTVACIEGSLLVTGRNNIRLEADVYGTDITGRTFDMVIVPGGPGHTRLRDNKMVSDNLLKHHQQGKFIASICAGPMVLHHHKLLEGKSYTCHFTTKETLNNRDEKSAVVVDGNIITSKGAGTATRFGLKLVELLKGPETAASIAKSIEFDSDITT
jgi:4-methyl-5(b-hydroxyethyl)-thiazole monophosphate biosynthesis